MQSNILVGMAATSHNSTVLTTAQFRDLTSNSNPQPNNPPITPQNLTATGNQNGVVLDWDDDTVDDDLAGYNVYRSADGVSELDKAQQHRDRLQHLLRLHRSRRRDELLPRGRLRHDRPGIDRPRDRFGPAPNPTADTIPPSTPASFFANASSNGIALSWGTNSESDLAGYRLYRQTSPSGEFVLVNTSGLFTATSYLDTSARPARKRPIT